MANVLLIKTYNIKTRGSFIFGYPKESALDILKTFWLIFKSGFEIHELVFSKYTLLYPKTSINKYLPENFDWHKNYSESELKQVLNVPVYMPPFDLIRRRFTLALFWFYVFYKGFTNLLWNFQKQIFGKQLLRAKLLPFLFCRFSRI